MVTQVEPARSGLVRICYVWRWMFALSVEEEMFGRLVRVLQTTRLS